MDLLELASNLLASSWDLIVSNPAVLVGIFGLILQFGWEKSFAVLIENAVPQLKSWQPVLLYVVAAGLGGALGLNIFEFIPLLEVDAGLGVGLTGILTTLVAMYKHSTVPPVVPDES